MHALFSLNPVCSQLRKLHTTTRSFTNLHSMQLTTRNHTTDCIDLKPLRKTLDPYACANHLATSVQSLIKNKNCRSKTIYNFILSSNKSPKNCSVQLQSVQFHTTLHGPRYLEPTDPYSRCAEPQLNS